jgi:SAM-dependent methyltransferase
MNEHFVRRDACPVCESRDIVELRRAAYIDPPIRDYLESFYGPQGGVEFEYLEGADFAVDECGDCGLIFQVEIPGPALSLKLYEEWIDPEKSFALYEARYPLPVFLGLTDEITNLVAHFDRLPAELTVLDFGMGWGSWCRAAAGLGLNVCGAEISPTRVENAMAHGIRVVDWDEIPTLRFDVINAEQVFEHLPDPLGTLRHLRRALKLGGLLRIGVPDGTRLKANLAAWDWQAPKDSPRSLNAIAPLEHLNCYTRDSLLELARRADLEEVRIARRFIVGDRALTMRTAGRKLGKALLGPYLRRRRPGSIWTVLTPRL